MKLRPYRDEDWPAVCEIYDLANEESLNLKIKTSQTVDTTLADATLAAEDSRFFSHNGVDYYSLEAIFAVGYRVRSPRGIQFRQWATALLMSMP